MKNTTAVIAASIVLLAGCGHGIDSGDGKKIGQVIQLGAHGWMCKTYEGKLVRGGLNTGSGVMGGVFEFTVEGEDLYNKLMKAMEAQQEIEATYKKVSFSGPCTCESDHFITGFRVMSETTPTVQTKPVEQSNGNTLYQPGSSAKERKLQELLHEILTEEK